MLKSLHQVKEDIYQRLMASNSPIPTESVTDGQDDVVEVNDVKRRMFPEQPLTTEELQCLTEKDELNRQFAQTTEEDKQTSTDSQVAET